MLSITPDLTPYLEKAQFAPDGLQQVWSGSATSVSVASLDGPGMYLIECSVSGDYWLFIGEGNPDGYGSAQVRRQSSTLLEVTSAELMGGTVRVRKQGANVSVQVVSESFLTMLRIYKAKS